jgi:glutaredoxin 1
MIKIYGTPNCSYCKKAKKICEDNNLQYKYLTVDVEVTVEQLTEMVGSPVKTVPQIFMSNDGFTEYVGGFEQLKTKIKNMTM